MSTDLLDEFEIAVVIAMREGSVGCCFLNPDGDGSYRVEGEIFMEGRLKELRAAALAIESLVLHHENIARVKFLAEQEMEKQRRVNGTSDKSDIPF